MRAARGTLARRRPRPRYRRCGPRPRRRRRPRSNSTPFSSSSCCRTRGAAGQLPRDATVSFVRLGALLAVVFEIVPPAPAGVASFPPTGAAAAPRTFEVKPLVVGPVDMDGVVEENASSSSSDDDDDVTRSSSGWAALRQKYKGRASYVEGESADYVATAPAYPTVTVCVVKISRRVRAESSRRPPRRRSTRRSG